VNVAVLIIGIALCAYGVFDGLTGKERARRGVLANVDLVSRMPLVTRRRRQRILDPEWQDKMTVFSRFVWDGMLLLIGVSLVATGIARLIGN